MSITELPPKEGEKLAEAPVTFGQAIRMCLTKYADFSGRARRSEYWWWVLFQSILQLGLIGLALLVILTSDTGLGQVLLVVLSVTYLVVLLALIVPGLAVLVRRLHDTGRSGWYGFLGLVPVVGTIVLIVFLTTAGDQGSNAFGPAPSGFEDELVPDEQLVEYVPRGSLKGLIRSTEIDTRMLGMVGLLLVIWVGFNIMSGGTFLSPRNLWNLSVQFAPVAIMATGMVLVIVSRNIDLSVGSMLGFVGMAMALIQAEILPNSLGFDHPLTWIVVLLIGLLLGALVGMFQGFIVAYIGVPSFIVTLGGLLVWRGVAWSLASGRTVAPMDSTFQLLGGGSRGSIGEVGSWVVGGVACAAIIFGLVSSRRRRIKFGFRLRPMWAVVGMGVVGCLTVLGAVWVMNSYYLPENVARQVAEQSGIAWPAEGLQIPLGISYPVLIAIGVMLIMGFIANRRRFGRYVFSIGGNPEAAELGGINTKWTVVKTFMVMGILVGVAAAVTIARLNAATSGLGTLSELYVIAAAVIGGTSLAGGIGTVPGAVLGALVMQSLQSGMVLMRVDAPLQDIVVGIVLVAAVAVDVFFRRRSER